MQHASADELVKLLSLEDLVDDDTAPLKASPMLNEHVNASPELTTAVDTKVQSKEEDDEYDEMLANAVVEAEGMLTAPPPSPAPASHVLTLSADTKSPRSPLTAITNSPKHAQRKATFGKHGVAKRSDLVQGNAIASPVRKARGLSMTASPLRV